MGEARRKKLAGVPQPTEKTPRPKTPKGRRAFRQVKVTYAPKFGKPQPLGPNPREFLVHADGTVYEIRGRKLGRQTIRIHDENVVQLVRNSIKRGSADAR